MSIPLLISILTSIILTSLSVTQPRPRTMLIGYR
jgi:hypothetical protein